MDINILHSTVNVVLTNTNEKRNRQPACMQAACYLHRLCNNCNRRTKHLCDPRISFNTFTKHLKTYRISSSRGHSALEQFDFKVPVAGY